MKEIKMYTYFGIKIGQLTNKTMLNKYHKNVKKMPTQKGNQSLS